MANRNKAEVPMVFVRYYINRTLSWHKDVWFEY